MISFRRFCFLLLFFGFLTVCCDVLSKIHFRHKFSLVCAAVGVCWDRGGAHIIFDNDGNVKKAIECRLKKPLTSRGSLRSPNSVVSSNRVCCAFDFFFTIC